MGGHCLQVPCSGFLLLLLLPRSSLHLYSGRTYFHYEPMDPDILQESEAQEESELDQGRSHKSNIERDFTFEPEELLPDVIEYCDGIFDVYYLLAKSKSTSSWNAVYTSLEDFVEKHVDPNQRISFILFDTHAQVSLALTENREAIRKRLSELSSVTLEGELNLNIALKKANEQIRKINSGGIKVFNIILIIITGVMDPAVLEDAKKEADQARLLGSYVTIIGLNTATKSQLVMIADDEDHVFQVVGEPNDLHHEVDKISTTTCPMVKFADNLCIGDENVVVRGYGFHNGQNRDQLICRLTIGDKVFEEEPVNRTQTSVTCPIPKVDHPGQIIKIEISLNNGTIYLVRPISANTSSCNLTLLSTTTSQPLTTVPTTTLTITSTPTITPTTTTTIPPPLPQVPPITLPEETETTKTTETTLPPETTTTTTPETVPPPESEPPPETPIAPPLPTAPPPIPTVPRLHFGPTDLEIIFTIVLSMMLIPVLLWWAWWLCCRKVKKPPPPPPPPPVKIKKKKRSPPPPPPPPPTVNVCPTLIVCCCSCRGMCVNRCLPGTRTIYGLEAPLCQPLPLTWYPSRIQGSCSSFSFFPAICGQAPCSSQIQLAPSQECVPVTYCPQCHHFPGQCSWPPSRVLSLISHSDWRARRPLLSLPPM
ncbi:anthrax toxin receptor-like [Thomomys bottae]